jgi:hypothetical protein
MGIVQFRTARAGGKTALNAKAVDGFIVAREKIHANCR